MEGGGHTCPRRNQCRRRRRRIGASRLSGRDINKSAAASDGDGCGGGDGTVVCPGGGTVSRDQNPFKTKIVVCSLALRMLKL